MSAAEVQEHVVQANLQPPTPNQQVFKDDCAYCFDTPESPHGLDVCLHCFSSSSPDPDHDYTAFHNKLTAHEVFLNIKKVPKLNPKKAESPKKIQKLAIEADTEEDHFDTITTVKDLRFPGIEVDRTAANLPAVIDGVLNSTSYARREEIQAWELEIKPCEHTKNLSQINYKQDTGLGEKCSMCDLHENLWLCLTCGHIGCGRAQFGGVAGNSHGLEHFKQTGCMASVKLGSITPEGNADVFCYACGEETEDPNLVSHLHHFGINIAERKQTEKSLTEMQIEHNLKYDFSMTTEDGKELTPLFGAALTGIRNLGNSCYMSSVIQCLFALPQFQQRYSSGNFEPTTREPANDLEVQMRKLADGLLSGRYAVPNREETSENPHQKGISPGMFKALIGRGHEEFSTMRQQDAFEFLIHLSDKIGSECKKKKMDDPIKAFQFDTEQRLECQQCHKVKYRTEHQENLSVPVPARKQGDGFETIALKECMDLFTAASDVDFKCPCGNTGASTRTMFQSFPDVLVLNARRFQIVNWVPTKLDIPVEVTDGVFELDRYQSAGKQPNEEEIPEEEESDEFKPNQAALEQLEAMGMPKVRAEKALFATGNGDAETAMNWLLEHMEDPDIDTPTALTVSKGKPSDSVDPAQVEMLMAMGFTDVQASNALKKNNGNVEVAVDWLFQHGDEANEIEVEDQNIDGPQGDASLPAKYRLKSIICHKGGSIHAGHYVAFVRKDVGDGKDSWVLFNDEKVVQGGEIDEMKKFAYIYMFERVR